MNNQHVWLTAVGCSVLFAAQPLAADAPPGRYTFPNDGVVFDTRTKLTWQREMDLVTRTQADAVAYCAALKLGTQTWRLPTRAELLTIVDPTRSDPAIDVTAFPNTPIDATCWTSSTSKFNMVNTWTVKFIEGGSGAMESTTPLLVRCVR